MTDKKTLLITGGCGFIGTNIALEAIKRGWKVICFDSLIRPKSEENIPILVKAGAEILRGDVRNPEDLQRSPIPDAIIHLAANPGIPWSMYWPKYDFNVNTGGTLNILEYSRVMGNQVNRKIPVIFASTNKVYSDLINEIPLIEKETRYEQFINLSETYPIDDNQYLKNLILGGWGSDGINEYFPVDGFGQYPHSPYGSSKLSSDQYCQEYYQCFGVPTVVNRMSCIYGLYQKGVADQGWIDHFVRQEIFSDTPKLDIFGDGKQVRDMLFGEDVARLYMDEVENIDKVAGQVFNIGGGIDNTFSLLESIEFIEEMGGKKIELEFHDWRHADQKVYITDISKVKKVLGWSPLVSPQEGVRRMFDAYNGKDAK